MLPKLLQRLNLFPFTLFPSQFFEFNYLQKLIYIFKHNEYLLDDDVSKG